MHIKQKETFSQIFCHFCG